MSICRGAITADNLDAPPCDTLGLPSCTYRQYARELTVIWRANPQYSNGPVGMEEHLAADENCTIVGMASSHRPGANATGELIGGTAFFLALIFLGVVLALVMDTERAGSGGQGGYHPPLLSSRSRHHQLTPTPPTPPTGGTTC